MMSQPHGDPAFHPPALYNNHLFVQRRRKRRPENFTQILCQGFQSVAGKKLKDAQKDLDVSVVSQYSRLTEKEIKTLVVENKWLTTLATDVQSELDRVSQALTGRVKQLAERYATPLPKLTDEVETISSKVEGHLKTMGFAWK
jgi:type I restriction enzyme M protein